MVGHEFEPYRVIFNQPVDYTGSCQMSRSIDPSTLPLPVSHPSQSSTALHNFDRHPGSEYRSGSLVCEKGLGIDFFAEHAIRLAMQAKAAAASVAAAQLEGHVSTSIVEKNFSTERCVYSPLSPTPVKIDCLPATTNRSSTHQPILTRLPTSKNDFMYPSAITFPDQLVNNSDPDPKQDNNVNFSVNAAQVASFVANADRLYLEEVASYTSRDRSDSMQTLTSSEASQLYGVLQHLRQQKQEFGSRHPPNTGHGFESNINISVPNIRSHRLENADKGPARPHSSEDASDHSLASLNENEIVGGTHSKIMNNTFPAISQTQSFGFPSPNFNEESHGSRKSASRIGHSTFLPDSVDPSCDPSTLISEARYRRRGYTESQINRRHISTAAGCNTDYNATGDHLAPTQSELPNKLPSVDEKSDVNLTSFTTATYIDALINSHLSRSTNAQNNRIRTPCNLIESGRSQSDSLTSFNTSSFSKCSLPELTVEESKLHNYRPDHLNKFHPDVQSQSTTGKHASLPIGSNTLESQINKAIAEEIRAQGVSRNSLSSNMCSPHQSRTPSPVNKFHATRNSDSQMFNLSVPPKKQDRSISRSPGVLNCLILSGSRDPLSNSAPKMSTHEPPVGKVSSSNNQDTVNKSNQKPANKVYDVVEEKRKASELMNKTSLTAIDSPANHSSSPSSDMESPGLLQIDLAVAEYSPKVALESSNSGPPVSSHSKDIHNFFSSNKNLNCIQSVTECGCDDSSGR
ncbi:unnamed protein product [Heterobilharzia americana]|nr:unnamed protein product [Heterobilharzia americana]